MKRLFTTASALWLLSATGVWAACSVPKPPINTTATSLSTFTADQVKIIGGCIDGTAIGQNTPAAGSFTTQSISAGAGLGYFIGTQNTLTSNPVSVGVSAGGIINVPAVASWVNGFALRAATITNAPAIEVQGPDSNISLSLVSKASGVFSFVNSAGNSALQIGTAYGTNFIKIGGGTDPFVYSSAGNLLLGAGGATGITINESTQAVTVGTLIATGFKVGGTAGATCTLTTVSHLTVVNGLVTVCD